MIQCHQCEFFEEDPFGNVHLRCDPYSNIKEPECLIKWQLLRLDKMVQAYEATTAMYERLAPIQEKLFRHMEQEIDEIDEADQWKLGYDEEDEENGDPHGGV